MAGIVAVATAANVASGTSKKTILQLLAPTNQRLLIRRWSLFCQGISGTAEPVLVQLLRQTTAGTMTAVTEVKLDAGSETLQGSAQHTATVEPTDSDVYETKFIHPQSGYEKIYPPDSKIPIPGGERVAIAVTAGATVDVTAEIEWEE